MGAPSRDLRPQYGWSLQTLLQDVTLVEPGGAGSSVSDVVERTNGMYRVSITGRVAGGDSVGTGRFGYYLEGSNTGGSPNSEWVIIAETNLQELFTASDPDLQVRLLGLSRGLITGEGFIGEAQVPVDRWRYLRVRTFVEYEPLADVQFQMTVRMIGIASDGQATVNSSVLVRASGDSSEPSGTAIKKPAGVRYVSAQAYVNSIFLDAQDPNGFRLILEAAMNDDAVTNDQWATIDRITNVDTLAESVFFSNGQSRLIDLNGFEYYRFRAERMNAAPIVPPDLSSFTITCYSSYDDVDWLDGEKGVPQLNENIRKTFCQVVFDPVTGAAPNLEIRVQICDMNQIPIREIRRIPLLLMTNENGFDDALSPLATFTSVTAPAVLDYGAGNNVAVVRTDEDGTAYIQLATGGAAPSLYIAAWSGWLPNPPSRGLFGPGQVIIATQRGTLL